MRADRLILIIMHLQHAGRLTAKELAQLLEVSERTIYRDIDALSGMGVPVQADAGLGGGFMLPANYRTKVDGLNTPEIHALFLQMNGQPLQQLGIDKPMQSALLKLLGSLSNRHREDADWIRNRLFIDMESWRGPAGHEDKLQLIRQAVWEQKQAAITYTDRSQTTNTFVLDSYGLVLKAGIWFVVGRAAEAVRAFRLANIREIWLMEDAFERPEGFELEMFWTRWMAEFVLRQFPYHVTARVVETTMSRLSKFDGIIMNTMTAEDDDRCRAELGFENEETALSAVMALAGDIQVEEPTELRDRIREEALRLQAVYG